MCGRSQAGASVVMALRPFGSRRVAPPATPTPTRPRAAGQRAESVESRTPTRRRWSLGRATMVSVGMFITVAIFVLGVMPTRQWINNRRAIAAAESTLAELEARNQQDTAAADSLRSGAELERLAREQYGYAKTGLVSPDWIWSTAACHPACACSGVESAFSPRWFRTPDCGWYNSAVLASVRAAAAPVNAT